MKIIYNAKWYHQFHCGACGSWLEAEAADVKRPLAEEQLFYYVICPVCGRSHSIPSDSIPDYVKEDAVQVYP